MEKPLSEFYSKVKKKTGVRYHETECKTCFKARSLARRSSPEARKAYNLKALAWKAAHVWPERRRRAEERRAAFRAAAEKRQAEREARRAAREEARKTRAGLSPAERFRVHYATDPDFRAHQIMRSADRKEKIRRATPSWADRRKIAEVYRRAAALSIATGTDYVVDHITPLRGDGVCGLHVHYNLRPLPQAINAKKRARYYNGWEAPLPRGIGSSLSP